MTGRQTAIAAMEGGGFYNRNSSLQAAGIERVLPLWRSMIQSVPLGSEPLLIADYGSSQGRNSMTPIRMAIESVRDRIGHERPVQVVHSDLPANDFSSLFTALAKSDSYMAGQRAVYPVVVGRSYFEPLLPPESVHLGWNSWTLHWLSRKVADAPDHVFASMSGVPEVRAAVSRQSAEDWRCFLRARSLELRQGGKLISIFVAKPADRDVWRGLGGELWMSIQDMVTAGMLSEEEQLRITIPTNPRSLADIEAPFVEAAEFAGLRLDHAEVTEAPDLFWLGFQETGDAQQLGQNWANMMRAVYTPTIIASLNPERDGVALVDALFARCAVRIAANPQQNVHFTGVAVLTKKGEL